MKLALTYFRQQLIEAADLFRYQYKAFATTAGILLIVYSLSYVIPAGWPTYLIMLPAALLNLATCYARLNALGPESMGLQSQVRRVGFLILGVGIGTFIGLPFVEQPVFPTWRSVMMMYGLALVFLSTPGMVPWNWWWEGHYRDDPDPDHPWSPVQRLAGRITKEYDRRTLERLLREKNK